MILSICQGSHVGNCLYIKYFLKYYPYKPAKTMALKYPPLNKNRHSQPMEILDDLGAYFCHMIAVD